MSRPLALPFPVRACERVRVSNAVRYYMIVPAEHHHVPAKADTLTDPNLECGSHKAKRASLNAFRLRDDDDATL